MAGEIRSGVAAVADRMPGSIRYQQPEAVPPLEQLAVGDRLGVLAAAAPVELDEHHAALKLAGHVAKADVGAVRRTVHELEHGLSPWHVDPWRLVEHLAEVLMRRPQTQPGSEATQG